jgi:hypothetical protein
VPPNERLRLTRRLELKYLRLPEVQIRHVFCAHGRARNGNAKRYAIAGVIEIEAFLRVIAIPLRIRPRAPRQQRLTPLRGPAADSQGRQGRSTSSNTLLPRRGLRPLATAGGVIGLE